MLDIDHCLPWSAWPCGDLWNLLPASPRVNQHLKRDRLPSASALAGARENIIAWWENALALRPGVTRPIRAGDRGRFTGHEWNDVFAGSSGGACAYARTSSCRSGQEFSVSEVICALRCATVVFARFKFAARRQLSPLQPSGLRLSRPVRPAADTHSAGSRPGQADTIGVVPALLFAGYGSRVRNRYSQGRGAPAFGDIGGLDQGYQRAGNGQSKHRKCKFFEGHREPPSVKRSLCSRNRPCAGSNGCIELWLWLNSAHDALAPLMVPDVP